MTEADRELMQRYIYQVTRRLAKDQREETARELEELIGHPQGGVCPFALPEGVRVYLDESLRAFDPVYPAAGAPNNAVELHLDELERVTGGQWVDVCKAG